MHETKVGPVHGRLARGCKLCGKGAKLVLFATGVCPFKCFYCPISEERRGKDVVFANERPVREVQDLLEEAREMRALGAGVTGGDPLYGSRTIELIRTLKENFGNFHIHLYTRVNDPAALERAYEAGVDEIRFHFTDPKPALEFSWSVGAEVPVIPGWETSLKNYILRLDSLGVEFINLNELEFSESNFVRLREHGLRPVSEFNFGVAGSEELAVRLVNWADRMQLGIGVHYCSARTKLRTQLVERYRRTARNIARPYEIVTEEGTIVVGVVPNSESNLARLRKLGCRFDLAGSEIRVSPDCARKIGGRVVEYWPTFDRKPVEITPV